MDRIKPTQNKGEKTMTIEEKIEELRKLTIEELKAQEPDTLKRLDWSPSVVDRVLFERDSKASKKICKRFYA